MSHTPLSMNWLTEDLVFTEKSFFDGVLSDMAAAREEIILETYIFKLDAIGQQVLEALQKAASRGVRIKLLIDGVGSSEDAETIASSLQHAKTEVRIYHPLPWNFSAYRWAMKHRNPLVKLWRFITEVNHRDHRKLCIIDERIAWLGSFNITKGHVEAHPVNRHETSVRMTGPAVSDLKQNFFYVWQHKEKSSRRRLKSFLSNGSLRHRKQKNAELIDRITRAKTRIWISNAYFSPSHALIKALKKAVKNKVDVQVIVPSRSDMHFFPALTRTFYADLLTAGLHIYEYGHEILHSKTMLVDNEVIIGSTNLNYRSYFHDLELDAILQKPETIKRMEEKFILDRQHSEEITLRTMKRFPLMVRMLGWVSRLLRYWL